MSPADSIQPLVLGLDTDLAEAWPRGLHLPSTERTIHRSKRAGC